jgi:hypothetical protein
MITAGSAVRKLRTWGTRAGLNVFNGEGRGLAIRSTDPSPAPAGERQLSGRALMRELMRELQR